jgi:hypothetical protein
MKYLVTARPGTTPIPPDQIADLYQAALEWGKAALADGRADCLYTFADGGGIAIGNAESHEAVFGMLLSYPMYPFFEWEVKPLCDWGQTFQMILEGLTRGGG